MIQIIGFLVCACLAVKLLEMSGNPALRDEQGGPRPAITAALWLGWASVFGFALWLLVQGGAFPETPKPAPADMPQLTDEQIRCISNAKSDAEILAC